MKKLSEIARIRLGYNFRTSPTSTDAAGDVALVLPSASVQDGVVDAANLPRTKFSGRVKADFDLSDCDIIMRTRHPFDGGMLFRDKHRAAGVRRVVAVAPYIIIRAERENVLPEYLHWLLGLPMTVAQLQKSASTMKNGRLLRSDFENLEFPIPALDYQQQILVSLQMYKQEKARMMKYMREREMYVTKFLYFMAREKMYA